MKPKVIYLFVEYYFPKSKKIFAQMAEELALGITSRGYKVIVIAPDDEAKNNQEILNIKGVDVKFFRNPVIKDIGYIRRTINELLIPINAFIHLRKFIFKNKPDFIIYFSPTIFFGLYILYLQKRFKVKSYLVLRDIFPQWAVEVGLIKKNWPIHIFFKFFEKINYKAASYIGLESVSGLKKFQSKFPDYNSDILFNWVSKKKFSKKKHSLRTKYNLNEKFIFFYGGNIGIAQDIPNILNLAKKLSIFDEVVLVLLGDGSEYQKTIDQISSDNIKNVILLEGVNHEVYIDYLSEIDIGLISLDKNNKGNNIPGKLLNYMRLKKPILGSVNPNNDIVHLINQSESGLISINGDEDAFFRDSKEMMKMDKRSFFSENSFKLIKNNFSLDSALNKILSKIEL